MTETVPLRGFVSVLFRMVYRYVAMVRCEGDMCIYICVCLFLKERGDGSGAENKTCVLKETKRWTVYVGYLTLHVSCFRHL